MVQKIKTYTNIGLQGFEITIESDMNNAIPTIEIIGLADTAIKESKERLRATFRNVGISLPQQKIVLNLAPSDIKKTGTRFDVPMAVAILFLVCPEIKKYEEINKSLFFGELGLDGKVKKTEGILPSAICAQKKGYENFFVPEENSYELKYLQGIKIYPVKHFKDIVGHFLDHNKIEYILPKIKFDENIDKKQNEVELHHIQGQIMAKRAAMIAAAGRHNILLIGSPGCGKTMLSKAINSLLPPLTFEESIEISQMYSIIGKLNKYKPLITERPFRQIHHTASQISIVGGGKNINPGEISLAHKGILFLDEITEFPREVLEVLRQPLEEKTITISRATGSATYPADFMLVASMNPCKCGYYKDKEKVCNCTFSNIQRYQSRLSGPLLDRIDMIIEMPREKNDIILNPIQNQNNDLYKNDTLNAREKQKTRFKNTKIVTNSGIPAKSIFKYIPLDEKAKLFVKDASEKLNLSIRTLHRTIKLARTIADLDDKDIVEIQHLSEAFQYRSQTMLID